MTQVKHIRKMYFEEGKNISQISRETGHYRFEAAFCNVGSGHEKGNVENKVGYHRRNMLVPVPRFESISEFNKDLLIRCEEDAKRKHYRKKGTIEGLYKDDAAALLELPKTAFDTSKYITVKTNGMENSCCTKACTNTQRRLNMQTSMYW
jgi:hypothetical protein